MSCRLVLKLVTLNDLEHHNGSKLWYQFPGVCLEVCLLVTDTHTALQRTWLVDTGAADMKPPPPPQKSLKTVNYGGKNLGLGDGRFFTKKPRFRCRFWIP